MNFLIEVEKDGQIFRIHPSTLRAHLAAGWKERQKPQEEKVDSEPEKSNHQNEAKKTVKPTQKPKKG